MRKNFLVFGSPLIEEEEIREVVATLRSGWIGTGPRVARFERLFKEYIGCREAVAVSSCTAALHLAMVVSGVGPGHEVITTPMTFGATANSIVHTGARPVFVDVEPDTGNIDPQLIEKAITPRTRAILPVHYAGRPCRIDAIESLARRHGLLLVEDAAHAVEAVHQGRKIGTIGDLTCFSFYATKNVTTAEGGMITTGDPELAAKIKMYALHGLSQDAWRRFSDEGYKHYEVRVAGYKYNMTDLQAALGLHQLARIERNARRRAEIWARYDAAFKDLPVERPAPVEPGSVHGRHLYTIILKTDAIGRTRDQVLNELTRLQIGVGVHYTALHLHPYYRETFGHRPGDFPNAEWIGARTLSLPFSGKLTDEDVEDVIAAVREVTTPSSRSGTLRRG
jgi:dTDP-4-amino-4,6-dideoxygalactose transaminase